MPATNKALNKFALFKGCSWVPCFSHVGNLALLDQLKIPSIAKLLSHAKQIVTVFRAGTFRKVFLLCASALLDGLQHSATSCTARCPGV
jgi:hypothetical protein